MTTNSYAITAMPRLFGSSNIVTDIDLLMSRVDDTACTIAAQEIVDAYRQVFPHELDYDVDDVSVFNDMHGVSDATTDEDLLRYIETWNNNGSFTSPLKIALSTEIVRALLRKMMLGLFTAFDTVITEPYPTYEEVQSIYPNGRPFIVAGGPEVVGGPPNAAYEAIMVIDELDLFNTGFTEEETRRARS